MNAVLGIAAQGAFGVGRNLGGTVEGFKPQQVQPLRVLLECFEESGQARGEDNVILKDQGILVAGCQKLLACLPVADANGKLAQRQP